ncbi:MAG: hypothetical protein EA357_05175 [Micavibrio sp.]|nr:MAG: hypothetical protein EA357_05175 [Micavibrio sp.]
MKKLAVLVVLLGAIGAGVYFYSGFMIKPVAQFVAGYTLGTKVTIADMDVSFGDKTVETRRIRIDNPQGFSSPHFMQVDSARVSARQLRGDVMVFENVNFHGIDIRYEIGVGGTNLGVILDNIKEVSGTESRMSRDVVIERLSLTGIRVTPLAAVAQISGQGATIVPDIVLTNIGTTAQPVSTEEALTQIMTALSRSVMRTVSETGLGDTFYRGLRGTTDGAIPESDMDQRLDRAQDLMRGVLGR